MKQTNVTYKQEKTMTQPSDDTKTQAQIAQENLEADMAKQEAESLEPLY